jgi:TonB family protein
VNGPGDILTQPERTGRAFAAAVTLHAALIGGFVASNWLAAHTETFGAKDAGGGAVAVQMVNAIPLQRHGPENHLATDTESEVPQTPPKKVERTKAETPPPDAVPIKSKAPKKTLAEQASEQTHIKKFKDIDPYQLTSKSAPALSSAAFAVAGSGRISPGSHNTLGENFSAYGAQIQQLVASHWRTDTVDQSIRSAPTIIATFDLSRDGSVHNLHILQGSNIQPLDASVERAIRDSSPLPPLPPTFPHDTASVEFWFELKR